MRPEEQLRQASVQRAERRKRRQRVAPDVHHAAPRLPRWLAFEWLAAASPYALEALLLLLVVGSVLAIGSVHPPVMVAVGAVAGVGLCIALWQRLGRRAAFPLLGPVVVLAALAAYSAFQLVPLPIGLLKVVAPANADAWIRVFLPLGEPAPAAAPLSLDPGATWVEVLRWFSYAAVFAMAAVVASRRGARLGVALVFFSAVVAALVTVVHGLLGWTEVFGVYEPAFRPNAWHVGPLLNPNNFSGYLNLGALCGMGLLLTDQIYLPRWMFGVGVAVTVGVNATTGSRGGVVVLLLAIVVLAIIVEVTRLRQAKSALAAQRMRWLLGGTVALGIALSVLGGTARVWEELRDKNLEKLDMLSWIRPMFAEFRWFGTGRGAFESVSSAFQPGRGSVVYTHAENFVAQWLVEWGLVGAVPALLAFAWLFRPSRMAVGRSMLAAGAWLGVTALLLHNLVDLGLEIPGVAIAVAVVLGSLWGDRGRAPAPETKRLRLGRRGAVLVTVAAGLLGLGAIVGVASVGLRDVASDRLELKDEVLADEAPRPPERLASLRALVRSSMLRHPAEPYFPLVGAMLAWQEGTESPMPWIQRALERSLANGKTHLLLAQVLMSRKGKAQALLELRLAAEADPLLIGPAAELAVRWASSLEELLATVPKGEDRALGLDNLGAKAKDRALGAACDRLAIELEPTRPGPNQRLANDILDAMASEQGCEEPLRCEEELEKHLAALEAAEPRRSTAVVLRSRWLAAIDEAERADDLLAEACEGFDDRDECLKQRVQVASKIDDPERLAKASKQLLTAVCIERQRCADTASWLGDTYAGRGDWGGAVTYYQRAATDDENSDRLVKLGTAASRAGLHAQATRALQRALAQRGGKDPAIEKLLAEERVHALGTVGEQ